jgi:hypothetical protein
MPLTVQIRWQPGTPRRVLITATTYDDFPLATLTEITDLEEVSDAMQSLVYQLRQDVPVRALRHQQTRKKTKPKTAATQRNKQPTPVTKPAAASTQPTQIKLF